MNRRLRQLLPAKPVLVIWEDVEDESKWQDSQDLAEWLQKPANVITIGFVARKTAKYLFIGSQYHNGDWGNCTKIPRSLIREIANL